MEFNVSVNFWAVLVSAIASMVIGSIWYGPLFGKKFMSAIGMDTWSAEKKEAEKKKMGMTYFGQFLASLVMFYVLGWLMGALSAKSPMNGLQVAFWVWLGFVAPVQFGQQIWGGKMSLFWLGAGNMLLTLLAAGAILGAWM
jgi:hypothetical protein